MIQTWTFLYDLLKDCTALTTHLGHTASTPRIFRKQQYKIINNKDHLVMFNTLESALVEATSTIRDTTIFITVLSRKSDKDVEEINEIILNYLDAKRITDDDNLNVYGDIRWDDFKTPPIWDEDDQCWFSEVRFRIPVSLKE